MTTAISVSLQAEFTVTQRDQTSGETTALSAKEMVDQGDRLMEALLALEESGCEVSDAAVTADVGRGTLELSVVASGPSYEEAEACGWASIRTAIHTIGGHTPEWQAHFTATAKRSEVLVG